MKPSRQFQPLAPIPLEERLVLSAAASTLAAVHKAPAAHVGKAPAAAPAVPAPTFAMNIADTIAAGQPVSEQRTTRYNDGSVETESRLIEPNTTNSSTLVTSAINLRNNGGIERISDFSYVSMSDANTTTHVITTTLPDGSIRTENKTEQVQGDTTTFNSSMRLPTNTGVQTVVGQAVERGNRTITDKTVNVPDGTVEKYHIVTVRQGESKETTTTTQILARGQRKITRATTTIQRLAPPAPVATGSLLPGSNNSGPTLVDG